MTIELKIVEKFKLKILSQVSTVLSKDRDTFYEHLFCWTAFNPYF